MATFPLTMDKHIIFCIIGFVFFMLQFFRQGFKYQIISAFAIAGTLLLYVNDSTAWRYAVGVIELILIIAIFTVMTIEKKKEEQKQLAAQKAKELAAEQLQTAGDESHE
jgi:predicted membrane protein